MLKSLLQLLLNRFINVSEKPIIGTLDLSRMTAQSYNFGNLDAYNSVSVTIPFSGFAIFYIPINVVDCSIRKGGWGDYARTGIPGDAHGRWQTLNTQVEKGETILFEAFVKQTGTVKVILIPYKNT